MQIFKCKLLKYISGMRQFVFSAVPIVFHIFYIEGSKPGQSTSILILNKKLRI